MIVTLAAGVEFQTYDAHHWTFTLDDRDGWQVCAVAVPPLCGVVLTCGHPVPAPAPSPMPTSTGDPGLDGVYPSGLVPMLPCGPADPFRQWHTCGPTPSPTG